MAEEDFKGMTALDHTCNLNTTNTLIKHGATHGSPLKALMNALYYIYNDVVDYLLENDLVNNINDKDETGRSALHVAASNNYEKVDKLIEKGADVDAKDDLGNTPLINAAKEYRFGMPDVVRSLLNHNADLEAKDQNGMTALHWAASIGNPDVVVILVEKKANVEAIDNNGKTPLDLAVDRVDGDKSVVDCLTKAKENY